MGVPSKSSATIGIRESALGAGNAVIVVAEPLAGDTALAKRLETRGEGIGFMLFEAENLGRGLEHLRSQGAQITEVVGDPADPDAVFVHPKSCNGVYIGLVNPQRAREQEMDKGIAIGAKVRP